METPNQDGRRKLTDSARLDIHRRYFERIRTGETVSSIADTYG